MSEPRWEAQCIKCDWRVDGDDGDEVDRLADEHVESADHIVTVAIRLWLKRAPLKGSQ